MDVMVGNGCIKFQCNISISCRDINSNVVACKTLTRISMLTKKGHHFQYRVISLYYLHNSDGWEGLYKVSMQYIN